MIRKFKALVKVERNDPKRIPQLGVFDFRLIEELAADITADNFTFPIQVLMKRNALLPPAAGYVQNPDTRL